MRRRTRLALQSPFVNYVSLHDAQHCAQRLHRHFAQVLQRFNSSPYPMVDQSSEDFSTLCNALSSDSMAPLSPDTPLEQSLSPSCTKKSVFNHIKSAGAWGSFDSPSASTHSCSPKDSCPPNFISEALRESFIATDQELMGTEAGEWVGTTAVVAVLGRRHIWVAHCGEEAYSYVRLLDESVCQSMSMVFNQRFFA